jgi:hypothetical protein
VADKLANMPKGRPETPENASIDVFSGFSQDQAAAMLNVGTVQGGRRTR